MFFRNICLILIVTLFSASKSVETDIKNGSPFESELSSESRTAPIEVKSSSTNIGKTITNSIGIKLVYIEPGIFQMGSNDGESDEKPVHEVHINKGFYMGATEVTQSQWERVMGKESDSGESLNSNMANYPKVFVNLNEANEFCQKLSALEKNHSYQLPTEAQWEYACRAGTSTKFSFGDDENDLGDYAWYNGNTTANFGLYPAHEVGRKKPNAWGLYDMHGNVAERCRDRYDKDYYSRSPVNDPENKSAFSFLSPLVIRGGWSGDTPGNCRSACRKEDALGVKYNFTGFRVIMEVTEDTGTSGKTAQPFQAVKEGNLPDMKTATAFDTTEHGLKNEPNTSDDKKDLLPAAQTDNKLNLVNYHYKNGEFTIGLPENWKKEEQEFNQGIRMLLALSPDESPDDIFSENINVVTVPADTSNLKEANTRGINTLKQNTTNFQLLDQGLSKMGINDVAWFIHTFDYEGYTLKVLKVTIINGSKMYLVTCTALASTFDRYRPFFDQIISSIKFDELKAGTSMPVGNQESADAPTVDAVNGAGMLGALIGGIVGTYVLITSFIKKKK
jgi:formylglycine-generating enzyme required for sulfatase activity